jgi:rRNA-processing protein FCF1
MVATVTLDTNALMMPVELDVRLFDELDRLLDGFDPVVPQQVVEELRRLSEKGGEEGIAASVGHDLATDRCLTLDAEASYADDAVVELARDGQTDYVVTNDGPLQDRVLEAGVSVIALRGKNKLAITRP